MNTLPGSTFLTGAEIAELTGIRTGKNGRTREQLQIEQLARMAIPHYVNAASRPIVARAIIEGAKSAPVAQSAWEPGLRAA